MINMPKPRSINISFFIVVIEIITLPKNDPII